MSHRNTRPTFYKFKASCLNRTPGVIVDNGACSSVVGKDKLDKSMIALNIKEIEIGKSYYVNIDLKIIMRISLPFFAAKMPFCHQAISSY